MSAISSPSIERGKSSASVPVTIPAGGKKTVNATGTAFHVLEAPCAVNIRMDTTAACLYKPGTGLETTGGAVFEWLEIENPSAAAITVLLYVGFAKYEDKRHTIQEDYTVLRAVNQSQIPANGSILLTGVPQGSEIQRKSLLVSNLDPAAYLYVKDSAGAIALCVFPLSNITIPVSGAVSVANTNGVAVSCYVSEIFYAAH